MSTPKTLVAVDVDGVLNVLKKPQRGLVVRNIAGWEVAWRPSTLRALKTFLSQDDVEAVWLTRWLEWPEKLDELSQALKLDEFISKRAEHPATAPDAFGTKTLRDGRFPRVSTLEPMSKYWWKFRSVELLLEKHPDHRFVWLDDELGYSNHRQEWSPKVDEKKLLYKIDPTKGLMPLDVRKLDLWHKGGVL